MLIKVCGMTSKEDIDICSRNKVDIVGFLRKQPDCDERADMLSFEVAKELIAYVPEDMKSCLLVHSNTLDKALHNISQLKPNMIQIQSSLVKSDLIEIKKQFPSIPVVKTFYVHKDTNPKIMVNDIKDYIDNKTIDFVLLESKKGGSGEIHDWSISQEIVHELRPFPVILAGGLSPDNIQEAINRVKPFGVDVMTNVSNSSKAKESGKINLFVQNTNC